MNWRPKPSMTQKHIEKAVNEAAVLFENKVRQGQVLDGSITFAEFIDRWMTEYAEKQLATKTHHRYVSFMQRIIPAMGHIRMDKFQPIHLIEFYNQLAGDPGKPGQTCKNAKGTTTGGQVHGRAVDSKAIGMPGW